MSDPPPADEPAIDFTEVTTSIDPAKAEAIRQHRRVGLWGVLNSIKQNTALNAIAASRLGAKSNKDGEGGEAQGDDNLNPEQICRLMEGIGFGSTISNLTINEPAPQPAAPQQPQQPVTPAPASPRQGLSPLGAAGLTAASLLGLVGTSAGTYWLTRPDDPTPVVEPGKPIEIDGVIEWEATRESTTEATE